MKRLVGYDLNGWRDLAVRNWIQIPGEDDKTGPDTVIAGGMDGSVVSLGKNRYIGGAQAEMAPHGRGPGWGAIGAPENRSRVRDLLASPANAKDRIAASLVGLAQRADVGVLAISDTGAVTEEMQETLLDAMRRANVRHRLLVWRPVLALLGAMGDCAFEGRERIGIVTHETHGFGTRILTLRQGKVLTPERRPGGGLHHSALGLAPLYSDVASRLSHPESGEPNKNYLAASSIPIRVILGEPPEAEVLRRNNGSWTVIQPPALPPIRDPDTFDAMAGDLGDCDRVYVETPVRGPLAEDVRNELHHRLDVDVTLLPPETVAKGARVATGLLDAGDPVFFDCPPRS